MKFHKTIYDDVEISRCGKVKGTSSYHTAKKFKTNYIDKDGYLRVWVKTSFGRKFIPVHRIVAMTFVKGFALKKVVNHKDGDRKNNYYKNLEWITASENERHARNVLGKKCLGEKASRSKLKTQDIIAIRRLRELGLRYSDIASTFPVSQSQIARVCKRKNWPHV